jgi:hypothetical protein
LGCVAFFFLLISCQRDAVVSEEAGEPNGDRSPIGAFEKLLKAERLRYSMTDLVHFADRSRDRLLAIDLGTIAARKYINGGWHTGWNPEPQTEGKIDYFVANAEKSLVFFKHEKGGFHKIIVRMRSVGEPREISFFINDRHLGSARIHDQWEDHTIEVSDHATRTGENQLKLRFAVEPRNRPQRKPVAHVDAVYVLPEAVESGLAPRGQAVGKPAFEGIPHPSLLAPTPQTYTYRLQLPESGARLGFFWGSKLPGATFVLTASTDTSETQTLFEATVAQDRAAVWNQKVLDLSEFAGQVAELDFAVRGPWPPGQLAAWGEPGIYVEPIEDGASQTIAEGTPARNVLVYLIDTVRYDKFAFYNENTSVKTPHIDAFAAEATIFDHAYDNENWTKPTCATILTGLHPNTHQTKWYRSKLPSKVMMISDHFQNSGFKTAAFVANPWVSASFGFDRGWNHFTNYPREKRNDDVDEVVDDALAWIDYVEGDRFFLYLHTMDPHRPYWPPEEWRKRYWSEEYDGVIERGAAFQTGAINSGELALTESDRRYLEALYDAEIAFNDHHFGRLIEGFKKRGLYDETAVLVIADHGEEFWDHGMIGHHNSLYEEMIHTVMVLRYPNMVPSRRRIPHVISTVDVAPTLLDLAGVDKYEALEGKSVLDTLDGVGDPHPRIAVSDYFTRGKSIPSALVVTSGSPPERAGKESPPGRARRSTMSPPTATRRQISSRLTRLLAPICAHSWASSWVPKTNPSGGRTDAGGGSVEKLSASKPRSIQNSASNSRPWVTSESHRRKLRHKGRVRRRGPKSDSRPLALPAGPQNQS